KSPYWEQNFGIGAIDGTPQDLDIDTIIIRVIPDETSALAEFKAGKLDIMGLTDFPSERKQMQADSRFTVTSRLVGYVSFMGFNLRRPFIGGENNYIFLTESGKTDYTKGVAIRKAICYAIDREEINRVIHDGEFLISDSPIYPIQAFWYYHDVIKYRHNIDAALEWLSAAGVIPEPTKGVPFPFIGALGAVLFVALYRRKKK
ncbi:MAG: ABC transporter substrate-binding protein, partial [Candidatus Heimdallarchaeaceae archaeon]